MYRIPAPSTKLALASVFSAGLLLLPVSFTSGGQLTTTDACAEGACCMEQMSLCGEMAGYYHSLSGECTWDGGGGGEPPKPKG